MSQTLKIDIVSDLSCPWCIIGYQALQKALSNLVPAIQAKITWQPFELNPQMPKEGQEITEHITLKYGITEQQAQHNRDAIKQRGLSVGYEFGNRGVGRIYNTFDAHRLLHWAISEGKQNELKLALFDLYFKKSGDPSDHTQLLEVVQTLGLDTAKAKAILESDQYAQDVRKQQQYYQAAGISSVPAVIVNDTHLISGGQPSEIFEQALKKIAAES